MDKKRWFRKHKVTGEIEKINEQDTFHYVYMYNQDKWSRAELKVIFDNLKPGEQVESMYSYCYYEVKS